MVDAWATRCHKAPLACLVASLAVVLVLEGCASGTATITLTPTVVPAPTATPAPLATATPVAAPTATLMPAPTAPPAMVGWMADYRPDWMGYIDASGALIHVTPDGLGSTRAQTRPLYVSPSEHRPGEQVVVTQPDDTGHIATWVFKPSTQNDFNQVLAQWKQALAAHCRAGPCTVGKQGYDANVTFTGPRAQDWCTVLESESSREHKRIAEEPTGMSVVCEVTLDGAQARAKDTGGRVIATDLCSKLTALVGVPLPANWNEVEAIITKERAVQAANDRLASALAGLKGATQTLKRDANFESVLAAYAKDWAKMQEDYSKMQTDAAKRPFDCYQLDHVVKYDLDHNVGYDLENGIKYDDGSLSYTEDNINRDIDSVNKSIQSTQDALAVLQSATTSAKNAGVPVSAVPSSDVDAAVASARKQVEVATSVVQKAKAQAADYDQKAAALCKRGQDFVAGLTAKADPDGLTLGRRGLVC